MKNKKLLTAILFGTLIFLNACSEDDEVQPASYSWMASTIPGTDAFHFNVLHVDEDGSLYALGTLDQTIGIFKLAGDQWILYRDIDVVHYVNSSDHFTIIDDVVYYSSFSTLYKIENSTSEQILKSNYIKNLSEFNGELIVIGSNATIEDYIVRYDGTSFSSLSTEKVKGGIVEANEKLYFPGYPGYVYDGETIEQINFSGNFFEVDEQESLYFGQPEGERADVVKFLKDERKIKVGESLPRDVIHDLEFFEETIVVLANENLTNTCETYFLSKNKWEEVQENEGVQSIIRYKNGLFGIKANGDLLELVRN